MNKTGPDYNLPQGGLDWRTSANLVGVIKMTEVDLRIYSTSAYLAMRGRLKLTDNQLNTLQSHFKFRQPCFYCTPDQIRVHAKIKMDQLITPRSVSREYGDDFPGVQRGVA